MIKTDKYMWILLERGGLAMKRSTISILMTAGLLAVLLSGCRLGGGTEGEAAGSGTRENVSKPVAGTAQEPVPESKVNQETEEDAQGKQETQGQQEPGVNQVPNPRGRSLVCRISCLKIWNHSIGISGIRIGCCS